MKKTIIGSLLLAVLLTVAPAGAATTCICVGMSSLIGNGCGNGGAGGRTWQIHTDIDNLLCIGFLKTAAVQAEFKNTGKAFDTNTGWFCFK
jgi:hypothetical protein